MHHRQAILSPLFVPLMPKGVEHEGCFYRLPNGHSLFVPLMPKGVEHVFSVMLARLQDPVCSVDAERR